MEAHCCEEKFGMWREFLVNILTNSVNILNFVWLMFNTCEESSRKKKINKQFEEILQAKCDRAEG